MDSLTTRPMPILVVVFAAILLALCSLLSCGQRPLSESLTATWRQSIKTNAFQETTGVALSNSALFVSDSKQASIYRLNVDGSARSQWPKRSNVIVVLVVEFVGMIHGKDRPPSAMFSGGVCSCALPEER